MKNVILAFAMFISAAMSFAQTTPDVKTREDYLRKSRHQKTAAWLMLGGGVLLTGYRHSFGCCFDVALCFWQ